MAQVLITTGLIGVWLALISLILIFSPWDPPQWLEELAEFGIGIGLTLVVTAFAFSPLLLL